MQRSIEELSDRRERNSPPAPDWRDGNLAHLPRGDGGVLADRALVGAARGVGARAPAVVGAGAAGRQPRQLLGPGGGRHRRPAPAPDPRAREVVAVEDPRPRPGARRHGPDPDRPRRRRRARPGPRDRGAARRRVHRRLPRRARARSAASCGRAAASAGSRPRCRRRRWCAARSSARPTSRASRSGRGSRCASSRPAGGGLVDGETPGELSARLLAEIRRRTPPSVSAKRRGPEATARRPRSRGAAGPSAPRLLPHRHLPGTIDPRPPSRPPYHQSVATAHSPGTPSSRRVAASSSCARPATAPSRPRSSRSRTTSTRS